MPIYRFRTNLAGVAWTQGPVWRRTGLQRQISLPLAATASTTAIATPLQGNLER
jgi:hypothetical protein